jgi:hypothetical protein
MSVIVYPVEGRSLNCAPQAALETDAKTADRLVETGAFTRKAPPGPKPNPQPYSATEDLDFYHNPRGDDHDRVVHPTRLAVLEGPAPAGSLDVEPKE